MAFKNQEKLQTFIWDVESQSIITRHRSDGDSKAASRLLQNASHSSKAQIASVGDMLFLTEL